MPSTTSAAPQTSAIRPPLFRRRPSVPPSGSWGQARPPPPQRQRRWRWTVSATSTTPRRWRTSRHRPMRLLRSTTLAAAVAAPAPMRAAAATSATILAGLGRMSRRGPHRCRQQRLVGLMTSWTLKGQPRWHRPGWRQLIRLMRLATSVPQLRLLRPVALTLVTTLGRVSRSLHRRRRPLAEMMRS